MTDGQARRPMDTASGDIRYRGMNMGGNAYVSRSAAQKDKRQQTQTAPAQRNAPAANAASAGVRGGGDTGRLFGSIKLDEEKVLIIFLIMILARSGADISLLAALGYLLM